MMDNNYLRMYKKCLYNRTSTIKTTYRPQHIVPLNRKTQNFEVCDYNNNLLLSVLPSALLQIPPWPVLKVPSIYSVF